MVEKFIKRSEKIPFLGMVGGAATSYERMTGFTSFSVSKNPKEYSRQYIDEDFEQKDVVGYSPVISFAFDLYSGNTVLEDLVSIIDKNKTGAEAVRTVIIVDKSTSGATAGTFAARKFDVSVIGDSEGGDTDKYGYTGKFASKSADVWGTVSSTDNWKTCTFTPVNPNPPSLKNITCDAAVSGGFGGGRYHVAIQDLSPTLTDGNTYKYLFVHASSDLPAIALGDKLNSSWSVMETQMHGALGIVGSIAFTVNDGLFLMIAEVNSLNKCVGHGYKDLVLPV